MTSTGAPNATLQAWCERFQLWRNVRVESSTENEGFFLLDWLLLFSSLAVAEQQRFNTAVML